MQVLVTGGTGVVGEATVTRLLAHGHRVRVLSRHARDDARQWPEGVEPWPGDVSDPASLTGAADGCEAVVHLVAIVRETGGATFDAVNVVGTENVVREAERAGAPRFVYVSSLGCDRGTSAYHRSKSAGEVYTRRYRGPWTIVRLANVYGPGDEVISLLLRWVRTLPAVPVLDDGEDEFEPVWCEDAGEALARTVERDDLAGRVLEVSGGERTCMNDVVNRLCTITNRDPWRIPIPAMLAALGTRLGARLGLDLPVDEGQLRMLLEGNVVRAPEGNALPAVLGVQPTALGDGLRRLADRQLEQLPSEGVGALERKRFAVEIEGSRLSAEALLERVRERFDELTPWTMEMRAEPGTPTVVEEGATLTMTLPMRGNIQVRVQEVTPRSMTLVTLQGHPLAGAVRILSEPRGDRVRFEVQVIDRPATIADWLMMNPVGGQMQSATWQSLLERVVAESGGRAPDGLEQETDTLNGAEASRVEEWMAALVRQRRRSARQEEDPPEREQPAARPIAEPARSPAARSTTSERMGPGTGPSSSALEEGPRAE